MFIRSCRPQVMTIQKVALSGAFLKFLSSKSLSTVDFPFLLSSWPLNFLTLEVPHNLCDLTLVVPSIIPSVSLWSWPLCFDSGHDPWLFYLYTWSWPHGEASNSQGEAKRKARLFYLFGCDPCVLTLDMTLDFFTFILWSWPSGRGKQLSGRSKKGK